LSTRPVVLTALLLLLLLVCAPVAAAQGPTYLAQPPSSGGLYQDGQTDRYLLGGTWLSRVDPADAGLGQRWQDGSATDGWTPVAVPNSYNGPDLSSQGYGGYVGWYRRDFTLPRNAFPRHIGASGRRWIVRFESVVYRATVWLNGREIGGHAGGYLPWELDLVGLRPGVNRLTVRVDNRTGPGDLPPGPGSNWWNFGGLQREVYLRAVAVADLERVLIRPRLRCLQGCAATVEEQATVRNVTAAPQPVRLRGTYGGVPVDFGRVTLGPHATWTAHASVVIAHPRLWAPTSPTLYRAKLTLLDKVGRPLGGYVDYSGIRSVVVKQGRLELNGRPLALRGVDLQEQSVASGAALTPAQTTQLLAWVHDLGASVIRVHYPVGPLMEELADRQGILIWSEVPVWGVRGQYFSQPGWLAHAREVLRENVLDNQNHPSILLWSIANEPQQPPTSAEAAYIADAVALVHRLDPTRPVGMALMGIPGQVCDPAYGPLQVIGVNEYFGLFQEAGGVTDDRDALSPFLDSLRACEPAKALLVTEFGFDGNRSGPVEEYGTYQFQANMLAYHLGVFASKTWLSGAILQTLQDFVAYPGYNGANPWAQPPLNQKGLVDPYGNKKPAFDLVSAGYHSMQQIGPPSAR
jgi:Glycosyl hydrolases family 2, TIM barrel domain/Glycosyl hydrolases family 2, sugar binding domain/Glycosyl hydrolases family 2